MATTKCISINEERIRKMIGDLGLTLADMDRLLSLKKSTISQSFNRGCMSPEVLGKLALYLRVSEDVLMAPKEETPPQTAQPVTTVSMEATEKWLEQLVIVMTDTNQKLGALIEMLRTQEASHKDLEDKMLNHFVSVNQWMNKISNTLKYGNK